MRTHMESRQDGFAVVVPPDLAARAGLRANEPIEIEFADGRLVVRPVEASTLADLLSRITPENLHDAWEDGPPIGKEML